MPYSIGIDTGGTFTDVVAVESETGRQWFAKVPSTPDDPSIAFMDALTRIRSEADIDASDVARLFHGTTVATNAILEHKGAVAGLLTTAGFRHVLEIGRHDAPRTESIFTWVKPARPIPPWLIGEVDERLDIHGNVVRPFDTRSCETAVKQLIDAGVESIAICFLHAYVSDAHERAASEIVKALAPDLPIALSSDVLPTYREYERSMATVIDAYLLPKVGRYTARLTDRLKREAMTCPFYIMKSNGGVASAESAAGHPAELAMSGLAAGAIGATYIGDATGYNNLITIDVGGTSADVCLVAEGQTALTVENQIGGFPLNVPMVDIQTLGAGGGSIAAVTPGGALTVGPKSAGAVPGPACYGKGGKDPTVTDANLVLGRAQDSLAGGVVTLDRDKARQAVAQHLAEPLGLSVEAAAAGVIEILDNNMAAAMRMVSIEKGYDPRDFAILAFGGAGPLHAGRLAELMGVPRIIVPPAPGVVAALGLMATDLKNEYVQACVQKPPDYDLERLNTVLSQLDRQAAAWLNKEGVPESSRDITRRADLRYARQGFELAVDVPDGTLDSESLMSVVNAFHRTHEQLYTYAAPDAPVEIVNLRVTAIGRLDKPDFQKLEPGQGVDDALIGARNVWLADSEGFTECPVYERSRLGAGDTIEGPAIVEQLDSTTLILAGHKAEVHDSGSIIITVT